MSAAYPDDPRPWEVLSSTYLHRKRWLTLRQDRVRLPGGGVIDEYFVNEFSPWTNVVAVTDDHKIVLVRQYRYGLGAVHFELPGGVVDPGEEPAAAARRELLEETGFGGGHWELLMTLSANPALQTNLTHTFLATGVVLQQPPECHPTEELSIHLIPMGEVRRIVLEGEVVQALHAAPLLKFLLLHPNGSAMA
jgi:8-oxo-dGTP pyrophosphatase MutT (NUDIX family)